MVRSAKRVSNHQAPGPASFETPAPRAPQDEELRLSAIRCGSHSARIGKCDQDHQPDQVGDHDGITAAEDVENDTSSPTLLITNTFMRPVDGSAESTVITMMTPNPDRIEAEMDDDGKDDGTVR